MDTCPGCPGNELVQTWFKPYHILMSIVLQMLAYLDHNIELKVDIPLLTLHDCACTFCHLQMTYIRTEHDPEKQPADSTQDVLVLPK